MRKANRSYVLDERLGSVVEGLVTLLFEIDLEIERLAELLNKAQRIVPGKLGIQFITTRKIDGKAVIEPALVRLVLQNGERKRWLARRIAKSKICHVNLIPLLPKKKIVLSDGKAFGFSTENSKETKILLREIGRLFLAREQISEQLGRFSHSYQALTKKTLAALDKSRKIHYDFEIDFSNPKIAFAKSQALNARSRI